MFPLERLNSLNVKITKLVTDSRAVRPGDTFVAYPGERMDGRQFIVQAIAQGANAVIYDEHNFTWNEAWTVPRLAVADLRDKAGWLADAVQGKPSEKMRVIGITGTNGKTSTSHWIAQALTEVNSRCALIGTLGNGFVGDLQPSVNTTPDAISVHRLFADYLEQGAAAVAMEVSSHALAQGRVNGVCFDVALLTNLSRDHLDYHGDMDSYAASKRKLFDWETLKHVVLNLDDKFGANLAEELSDKAVEVIGYGLSDAALKQAERMGIRMVYGRAVEMSAHGIRLNVHSSWGGAQLSSELIGRFNAENLLAVLAVLLVCEVDLNAAARSLALVPPVAGRMQRLGGTQQPTVVVDYAHTPDALEKVLMTLRELQGVDGELRCVFGCGGDRDRGKRAMMGMVAEKFADHCIITSDNPRNEEPQQIITEIVGGMSGASHEVVFDRSAAIRQAIARARQQDTVLVAGKGHENYQEIAGVKYPFSDVDCAEQALKLWRASI